MDINIYCCVHKQVGQFSCHQWKGVHNNSHRWVQVTPAHLYLCENEPKHRARDVLMYANKLRASSCSTADREKPSIQLDRESSSISRKKFPAHP